MGLQHGSQVRQREEKSPTVADVVPAMMAYQQSRVARGELSAASLPILRNRIHNSILPFF